MARKQSDDRQSRHDPAALEQVLSLPYRDCQTEVSAAKGLGVVGCQLGFNLFADATAAVDMIPELSVETVERAGARDIRHGDAFQLIEQLDDTSVDLIITSPPYWGHRTYGLEHNWNILREWEKEHTRWEPPPWEWYRDHGGVLGLEPIPEWYVENLVTSVPKNWASGPVIDCFNLINRSNGGVIDLNRPTVPEHALPGVVRGAGYVRGPARVLAGNGTFADAYLPPVCSPLSR